MIQIKRALISVSDKTGLDKLVETLAKKNVEIISTGGTAKYIESLGVKVVKIDDFTGFPEILSGRVKTLNPLIHGGLLAIRDDEEHQRQVAENNIKYIDLVCVNLYPFSATVAKPDCTIDEAIENIDIGGPSMIRSAAKNHKYAVVLTNPNQYDEFCDHFTKKNVTQELARKYAIAAFNLTAYYDSQISAYFNDLTGNPFPQNFTAGFMKVQDLRYGENPHQKAALYREYNTIGIPSARQIQGKELSYNNIMDADAAISIVREFSDPAVAIIKHANPCGAAIGGTIEEAYQKAYEADTVSAYGGIVATNRPITKELAEMMSKLFLEVIVAPEIEPEAAQILSSKQNLRILLCENNRYSRYEYKKVAGGLLVQDTDRIGICELTEKTGISDTTNRDDLNFAWIIAKHVKSNAIVVTKNGQTLGIGAGQMSRIESVNIALAKAGEKAKGAVLASDGYFPFSDNVEAAGKYGIKAIVQPGGSIRDPDVIAKSQELGIVHYFTGQRHFKH